MARLGWAKITAQGLLIGAAFSFTVAMHTRVYGLSGVSLAAVSTVIRARVWGRKGVAMSGVVLASRVPGGELN